MDMLNNARQRLAEKGYKWTGQRSTIIRLFFQGANRHKSAEELHEVLQRQEEGIGLATVYRTLEIMVETGLVHKLQFGDGCSRYELAMNDEHHHHHLVCYKCGRVFEVDLDLLEKLEQTIEEDLDFSITNHHLKFYGLCSNCKKLGKDGESR